MIVAAQYNLATDPEYDSMAPAISIVVGWFPGVFYSSFCVLVVFLCTLFLGSNKYERSANNPMDTKRRINRVDF